MTTDPEEPRETQPTGAAEHPRAPAKPGTQAHDADQAGPAQETVDEQDSTVMLVSRHRSLNLGGLVLISLALGAIAGLIWGIIEGVTEPGTLVLGALYGAMFIGGALAFLVVIADWVLERSRNGR